ncbi:hypothetical protein [Beijerinckia indica]|uniref:VOC domain-containing protein n=1 Tax=Beijerinckia indica subsp. indica (strain ATCC 9039 / DSM 1715 / NCIMB 8712) TaxID=395963 RepID=B2IER2_BEII9|nr:hypothetical protein [Beijerinckia indica]ACB97002.1 conserved hypothetical protein [Beijerinckia indica subsp. indica ATCC 9039]
MIFHVSIEADDPRHIAQVIAELWGGIATPFPPVIEGSWVALAGDTRNSLIEVYPRGTELVEAEGDADSYGVHGSESRRSATHIAIASSLSQEEVLAIAQREGWPAKYRKRGGAFGVIELWIEGSQMIEVLTPPMQKEYRETLTIKGWTDYLASVGVMPEAATA